MNRVLRVAALGLVGALAFAASASAQTAYIGYVYPAGAQQGTTVEIRLGGQRLTEVYGAEITGQGVSARVVQYWRKFSPQDTTLVREQVRDLKQAIARLNPKAVGKKGAAKGKPAPKTPLSPENAAKIKEMQGYIERIEARTAEYCNRPACAALAELTFLEVTVDKDAAPGRREIRLATARGMTNPLPFYVGELPETTRKAMKTADFQVLGKEELALRKRPDDEVEVAIPVPCTMNGQVASGEVNLYRFQATKGQRLVVTVKARDLIPYIADAVPGWFQPIVAIYGPDGREVAFNDDFRFKPDPTLMFDVPADGQYVLAITDAIHRGREDFVYRLTIGELPFVTSIFPLGGRVGEPVDVQIDGWNLNGAKLAPPPAGAPAGMYELTARCKGHVTNAVPFALDTLPECLDEEANDELAKAQKVKLPIIVNGRIDRQDDWDVFEFEGRAGQTVVAEVMARRLDSPLDSMLKLTNAKGKLLALNDDCGDPGDGLNTHHADSYLTFKLPADGTYYVHLGDTARAGGSDYGYRLRISPPRPDFELRVTPSGGGMRSKSAASPTVYVIRKDGFNGDITLALKDPPKGFVARPLLLGKGKESVRFTVKTTLKRTDKPVALEIEGTATVGQRKIAHLAIPAEDRMQAFLWRHLVPAQELSVLVLDPSYEVPGKRVPPELPEKPKTAEPSAKPAEAPKFSKRQVARRLLQLKSLYQENLLTDEFYLEKVAECETAL